MKISISIFDPSDVLKRVIYTVRIPFSIKQNGKVVSIKAGQAIYFSDDHELDQKLYYRTIQGWNSIDINNDEKDMIINYISR